MSTTIGERIRTQRKLRGLSIRMTAELAGIDASTLSRIERGERGADNRRILASVAQALQCSVVALTGQPDTNGGRDGMAAAANQLLEALLDSDLDLPPVTTSPRPIPALAVETDHMQQLGLETKYLGLASRLPQLLRDAHAHVHGPDREQALRILANAARWSMVTLKNSGHPGEAWVAAERSRDAAVAVGDPVLIGLAAWTRGLAATNAGAFARAVHLAMSGIEVLRDEHSPDAMQMRGALHLLAGWAETLRGDGQEGEALIRVSETLARECGETHAENRDHLGLIFGPTNVWLWKVLLCTEADPDRAVGLAREVIPSPTTLPLSRLAAFYMDLGRALVALEQDNAALRTLLAAERVGPERVQRSPLVAEAVRSMVHRQRRTDPPALIGLAERVGVTRA